MAVPLVTARGLTRTFRRTLRQDGAFGLVRQLVRPEYEEAVAVDGIDLDIARGEAVGYVGANGAGKSTTIKLLSGILTPTSGELHVAGMVPWRERVRYVRRIGVVFGQRTQLWPDLAVQDSYSILKEIYRIPEADFRRRLDEHTELLELGDLLRVQARKLSLGQRMRADLGAAFLHRPELVLLDEPTIGLDFEVKERFRVFLREMVEEHGATVLLATHDLRDIEDVCDRLIIIHEGRLICDDTLASVREQYARERIVTLSLGRSSPDEAAAALAALGVDVETEGPHEVVVRFDRNVVKAAELVAAAVERVAVEDIAIREPRIEDVVKEIYRVRAAERTAAEAVRGS
jgi:ABC-2 type transport system ATP-binding protein